MQYIRPFKNPEPVNVSPVRESRSLRIDDIPGAKSKAVAVTKNILHYQNRLSHDKSRYQENMQNHQFFNNHEYIFGGELKVGLQHKLPHGKRHYGDHYRSEISETGGIKRGDPTETHLQAFDYPRNLNIADIPGTLSGSAKPKSLINHDLAQRARRGASVQRERPEDIAAPRRQVGDSLDRFQQEQVSNIVRERRGSRNEDNERKGYSITQEISGLEAAKKEQPHQHPREHGSEGNIKQVFNSSVLYRNAAGHPTRKGDMSFDNISRRKMSSQDYTVSYDKNQIGTLSERKDETPTRTDDNQYGSAAFRDNSRATTVNEIMTGGNRKPTEPQRQADSKGWKESVLEQAYGKIMNKKDEFKKVYTYNIISNQPNQKMLPSNARLPYRYAIPFDVDHLTSNKRDTTEQQNQAEMKRAYNLVLQHNNIGREYNQSVSEHDYQ